MVTSPHDGRIARRRKRPQIDDQAGQNGDQAEHEPCPQGNGLRVGSRNGRCQAFSIGEGIRMGLESLVFGLWS